MSKSTPTIPAPRVYVVDDLITVPDAATLIGVSRQRVHQLIESGNLTSRRIGVQEFLSRKWLARWLKLRRKAGGKLPLVA